MGGPLQGVRVVELLGQGPAPWAGMMLSDLGAEVVRVDRFDAIGRVSDPRLEPQFVNHRGRRSIAIDLKHPDGVETLLRLSDQADALIEGFRPGVVERLGVGPDVCCARNPRLVYGRMTGWGQEGPWSRVAGHDINYLALSGMLSSIGERGRGPVPPLNLAGDFGGGALFLCVGILSGLIEARSSGKGQVIDAAMLDGAALLGSMFFGLQQSGRWKEERGENFLDGGAPFYATYETADEKWISVGAMEPKFYTQLITAMGLAGEELGEQYDQDWWPANRKRFAEVFRGRTREEWAERLGELDACYAPVLAMSEASSHEQALARESFVEVDGVKQPAPAPRFSRTPGAVSRGAARVGEHSDEILREWSFEPDEIDRLREIDAVGG